jgi:hypothetical protein
VKRRVKRDKPAKAAAIRVAIVLAILGIAIGLSVAPYRGPIYPTLDASLEPLRSDFVQHTPQVRLVMIIDPT